MRSGPMVRFPAREKFYKTQRQKRGSDACPFCEMVTLTDEERLDYMQQVGRFADEGYSLYARAPGNVTGSVAHQHMHLIKTDNKRKKFLFFLRKPHVVVMK
ncbi:MAG: hypothetical protein Q4F02_03945 [Candidatus Saccharibacteria bacterium]|nr:hypothetical protein [Candidatus Saccharibacteria bacterium]